VVQQTLGNSYILEELDGAKLARLMATVWVIPYITRKSLELLTIARVAEEINTEINTEPEVEAETTLSRISINYLNLPLT
jgi:hypothetical protein